MVGEWSGNGGGMVGEWSGNGRGMVGVCVFAVCVFACMCILECVHRHKGSLVE